MPTFSFNGGHVVVDATNGIPIQFVSDTGNATQYILPESVYWHNTEHRWGSGEISTYKGAAMWSEPQSAEVTQDQVLSTYDLSSIGLQLVVKRDVEEGLWHETYTWKNTSNEDVVIDLLKVQTPFNDRYPGGMKALDECVNAHVYAAGAYSWVLAESMSGMTAQDPALWLKVTEGSIYSYSIESRNAATSSNVRGHIVLNVTDYALNPRAFGGQHMITLHPGEEYVLAWKLGWASSRDEFDALMQSPMVCSAYAANLQDSITITSDLPVQCIAASLPAYAKDRRPGAGILEEPTVEDLEITKVDGGYELRAKKLGSYIISAANNSSNNASAHNVSSNPVDAKTFQTYNEQRSEILFHESLKTTVQRVANYVIHHQVAVSRPGTLAGAIVPVDTRTGIRFTEGGWSDWSDGSERISMVITLQKAINRKWIGTPEFLPQAQEVVNNWRAFAVDWLMNKDGLVRRGSLQPEEAFGDRIYDMPWFVEFFCDHYQATHCEDDLNRALLLLDRMSDLGGAHFLAISFAEVSSRVANYLREAGREEDAQRVIQYVIDSAEVFQQLGTDLPDHEVAYEQSITAPLVNLFIEAHRITGEEKFLEAVRKTLPWLLSFGGPQPSVRLNAIGLRHWDGYWFGINRQFGDVFPHYWSALSATALVRLPQELKTEETDKLAERILRANMVNYNPDGSGTCAFLYPSSVDGRSQYQPDPLANDQNWHLAIWMRLLQDEGFKEV